ncbi:N-acetyltransferase [Pseudovibrio exalbescens]|uniref:GNAT family N-acetyltransferase n=1 Tax=Pseudovibrio exalbescens TaxID=197461 RepID=UPI0023659A39|nr:N-acetyltransferase [Pseudovibrio exalbescens]MDD7911731.1 N-acetyltransferase [Pseudovibrio exalbescens]
MQFTSFTPAQADEVTALFRRTFSASEGENEGELIGTLAANLLASTPEDELLTFLALEDNRIQGAIVFTRFHFEHSPALAYLLSPVAVAPEAQGNGVGQALIKFGLQELAQRGAEIALTYGDPNFYGKVGFKPIAQEVIAPPLKLTYPEGWIAQSLTNAEIAPISGATRCAAALNHSEYW